MKEKDMTWVSALQVGDKVASVHRRFGEEVWQILTVEKVTPSGRLNLSFGYTVNPDGTFRGDSFRTIYQMTPKIQESVDKQHLRREIKNQLDTVDIAKATLKQLKQLNELLGNIPTKQKYY